MRDSRFWAVIPAAGVGRRLGAAIPKQYLDLAGRPVIDWSLTPFVTDSRISGVWVALGAEDEFWSGTTHANHPKVRRVGGGAERCHSVLNVLEVLIAVADPDDWVLVHDAARPCLRQADLDRLITEVAGDAVGGILAVPVRDTMKGADGSGRIRTTLDRSGLWHAFTPQMFRLGALYAAYRDAIAVGELVTDEAGAMERVGLAPRLVEGHADNLKITRPEDLSLARFYLELQASEC